MIYLHALPYFVSSRCFCPPGAHARGKKRAFSYLIENLDGARSPQTRETFPPRRFGGDLRFFPPRLANYSEPALSNNVVVVVSG